MPDLVIALIIPAVLWGALFIFFIVIGRTWVDMLLVLAGILIVLLLIGVVSSGRDALIASVILHIFLVAASTVSFTRFHLKEKRKKRGVQERR